MSNELRSLFRESVPYVKLNRYNAKHLCLKLNGFGHIGQRKVLYICGFHVLYLFSWLTRDHNLHVLQSGKQTSSRRCECIIGVSAYATQSLLMRAETGREHEMDSVMEKIIINADDDDYNDDTSESTVSCDDNDDIQGVVPIVSDSK